MMLAVIVTSSHLVSEVDPIMKDNTHSLLWSSAARLAVIMPTSKAPLDDRDRRELVDRPDSCMLVLSVSLRELGVGESPL